MIGRLSAHAVTAADAGNHDDDSHRNSDDEHSAHAMIVQLSEYTE